METELTEHECNPAQHPNWTELKSHCDERHDADMRWAQEVINASKDDRAGIKIHLGVLDAFKDKVMYGLIAAFLATILSVFIAPYMARNGDSRALADLKGYIAVISGQLEEHSKMIEKGNKISSENQEELVRIKKELKLK